MTKPSKFVPSLLDSILQMLRHALRDARAVSYAEMSSEREAFESAIAAAIAARDERLAEFLARREDDCESGDTPAPAWVDEWCSILAEFREQEEKG